MFTTIKDKRNNRLSYLKTEDIEFASEMASDVFGWDEQPVVFPHSSYNIFVLLLILILPVMFCDGKDFPS